MTVLPAATTDAGDDVARIAFRRRRCMSFCLPCFPSETTSSWWENLRSPATKERWWCRRWNPAREWKTFIRRFNNNNNYKKHCSFRYDPLSYALNFDEGNAAGEDGYGHGYGGFSARFASVSQSEKESRRPSREEHVPPFSKIEK
ncbi:hypothetical protein E2542_SST27861 [Spatholobus suberectus]|nr:hypothetical protein E2542_SST27861 [Spatholobus suberectus]